MGNKKRQADYIAPLQPPTLAAFRPWEGSAGAGRVRPAAAKISIKNLTLLSLDHIAAINCYSTNQFIAPVTKRTIIN